MDSAEPLCCPGVDHHRFELGAALEEREAWLDESCALVDDFLDFFDEPLSLDGRAQVSCSVHLLADVLFDSHGADADWERLDPHAVYGRLHQTLAPELASLTLSIGSGLYLFMAATDLIDRQLGALTSRMLDALSKGAVAWADPPRSVDARTHSIPL